MSQLSVEPAELDYIARQAISLSNDLLQTLRSAMFAVALGDAAVAGAHSEFEANWHRSVDQIAHKLTCLGEQLQLAASTYAADESGIASSFSGTTVGKPALGTPK